MKTTSNLLHRKQEDDGDGSSSCNENVNAVRDVSARRTAVIIVSSTEECDGLGRPEQRPDNARKISI